MDESGLLSIICTVLIVLLVALFLRFLAYRRHLRRLCLPFNNQSNDRRLTVSSVAKTLREIEALVSQLQQQLHQTGHDKLTGLGNRLSMKQKLAELMPLKQGSLVLLDIYRFRYVNDLFGFDFGDELLKQISCRIETYFPKNTTIARMNEDEFLIYIPTGFTDADLMALIACLQHPYTVLESPMTVRIQLGHLELERFHGEISTMLRRLDLALKKAKLLNLGLAHYCAGDDEVQIREVSIINSLAKALQDGELYMVYQPKQNCATGRCDQVEALMRWTHKTLGVISPAEFIPLAEYAGMIDMVSQWVLDQVVLQQAKWREIGVVLQVAVNLSTQDLKNQSLIEEIEARLEKFQLPANALSIELTESKLMEDIDNAVIAINRLRHIGVDIAIDDFGTGHSSLAYLKYLPVDEVKIDKAFIEGLDTDEHARHIMDTSIRLAKGLGFKVTVEGVETESVRQIIIPMGVDKIQGDIFAKPLTPAELEISWPKLSGVSPEATC
ncbi:bifunctional diguanylate cyclase/phosphodiesterase [Shewanella abyssi]|uniref:putative bifunctional diguanylate cyclase/phosphodiesterase n=1 Tax=Shewanella abyssi TaxID=311789 RepID=UPI00200C52F7|nr:bifunctional diguanylate cyclase/phosphodiesterase [Shewanella abyssi]MCL1051150.1 bifunctional diguanylate cyclase/phosphodiesterase [Shewanella abyssi]